MKPVRFAFAADNHGNHVCPRTAGVFFDFLKAWKPAIRIHGGDCFDFAALRKGASDEEQRGTLRDDLDAGLAFLDQFKPTHFLRGNHDERLWDLSTSDDGPLADLANSFIRDIDDALKGVRVYPYHKRDGICRIGDTAFMHGYQCGMNAARNAAMAYGKCVIGHVHTSDEQRAARHDDATGHSSGALCILDQRYNRAHVGTLRQNNGWVYGLKIGETFIIHHAKPQAGVWLLPDSFSTYSAA